HTAIDGAFEPENTQDAACRQASYCAAIERLTKGLLEAESVCAIKTECGAFWRTKNAHVARIEMIEWLYKISTPSYLDCRAFHLSIQYLDQFLNDIVQPIENGHLKNYALASVIEASPHIKVALPDSEKYLPETSEFKQALTRVVQNLDWCLNLVHGAAGKTFVKTIDMPTIADFLLLSFQRAAIELPERFADKALIGAHKQRHGQDQVDLGDDVQAVLPRQFAIGPFAKACRLASNILRDEYSLLFRSSELAAACFLIAAELEGIDLCEIDQRMTNAASESSQFDIVKHYNDLVQKDSSISTPVAAVDSLVKMVEKLNATTMLEFMMIVRTACEKLKEATNNSISLSAGCDVFLQQMSRLSNAQSVDECRKALIRAGSDFVQGAGKCRENVAEFGSPFVRDDQTILVHSYSRVIMGLLRRAVKQNKRFRVYITESRPDQSGLQAAEELKQLGVPCEVILDAAVGYIIEKVDLVLVGAEGVVESGGLINKIGTYQLAIIAKAAKKPFYALAESFKFVRLYPLSQYDLPTFRGDLLSFKDKTDTKVDWQAELSRSNPMLDYTPPDLITL
ncbi:translation initiation factor eIF-2B subunit alpha, partial [Coemansia sp. RSA 2599]